MAIKKIVILSELDCFSERILRSSAYLAERLHISDRVLLTLIIPMPADSYSGIAMPKDAKLKKYRQYIEEKAAMYISDKVCITCKLSLNNSLVDLNQYIKEWGTDLIVCGINDGQSIFQYFIEANTGEIAWNPDCPLIVLPNDADIGFIHNILVPIDSGQENPGVLFEIAAFAGALHARMQLLHVHTDDTDYSEQTIRKLRELAIQNQLENYDINVVNDDSMEDGICNFARKNNSDMLADLSQGNSIVHGQIFGKSTEDIFKETNMPVYVCNKNK